MPLLAGEALWDVLRCPRCRSTLDSGRTSCTNRECRYADQGFRRVVDQPVLIDADASIVDPAMVAPAAAPRTGMSALAGRLGRKNTVAARVADRLIGALRSSGRARPTVLVVGGGTVGSGLEALYAAPDVDLIAFDIFPSRHTRFVADAHSIPLRDECVDAVVVQAVLEHVLDPWTVVGEIRRVLRRDGLVFADTPFLQQVHEGPYDFTRFTESGHRWLFRDFTLIESGVVAGPGTQLAWSLAHAARSIIPLRGVATAVQLAMTPLSLFVDRFARHGAAIDGASSVYFLGSKSGTSLRPRDIVGHYRGSQRSPDRHV